MEVTSVAGSRARLVCELGTSSEEVFMIFWYKSASKDALIYSADGRSRPLAQAKQWSNPKIFGERATMRITSGHQAELYIDRLLPEDAGLYRCRLDFRNSPTTIQRVNLTVIG